MTQKDRRVYIYKDDSGEYRWRRVALNGEIVADSAEGYTRKHDAAVAAMRENPGLTLFDRTGP